MAGALHARARHPRHRRDPEPPAPCLRAAAHRPSRGLSDPDGLPTPARERPLASRHPEHVPDGPALDHDLDAGRLSLRARPRPPRLPRPRRVSADRHPSPLLAALHHRLLLPADVRALRRDHPRTVRHGGEHPRLGSLWAVQTLSNFPYAALAIERALAATPPSLEAAGATWAGGGSRSSAPSHCPWPGRRSPAPRSSSRSTSWPISPTRSSSAGTSRCSPPKPGTASTGGATFGAQPSSPRPCSRLRPRSLPPSGTGWGAASMR